MTDRLSNERGAAMLLVLGVLAALAVLAMVVMSITTSEKRTQFAEYSNNRAFYSADAAGEAGVAWLRRQGNPPVIVDSLNHVSVAGAYTALSTDHMYQYDVRYVRKRFRAGWGVEFKDYEYRVEARGTSAQQAESAIDLGATRLYREGY